MVRRWSALIVPSVHGGFCEMGELGGLVPVGDHLALSRSIIKALDEPTDPALLQASSQRYAAESSIDAYVDALGLS